MSRDVNTSDYLMFRDGATPGPMDDDCPICGDPGDGPVVCDPCTLAYGLAHGDADADATRRRLDAIPRDGLLRPPPVWLAVATLLSSLGLMGMAAWGFLRALGVLQ